MRLPHHLIYRPSGFSFRLSVPAELRPLIGLSVITKALQTHDRRLAQAFALVLASQYRTFKDLRGEGMARNGPPSVAELLQGFQEGSNFTYKLDLEKGILEADDDADHARAMQAMDRLAKLRTSLNTSKPRQIAKPTPTGLTLESAIQNYSEVEAPGLKADTWDGRQRALKSFVDALGGKTLVSSITRPMAAEWASDLVRKGGKQTHGCELRVQRCADFHLLGPARPFDRKRGQGRDGHEEA